MAAIAVEGVTVAAGGTPLLTDVDLAVGSGERLGLLGRSGSGKTALLRVMAGLDRPARGRVLLDGRPVASRSGKVAMVFQGDAVYEHLDVAGNLAFPLDDALDENERQRRVEEVARRFRLSAMMDRSPATLSAGQRRVVAAARALVRSEVAVVLIDDPRPGGDPRLAGVLLDAMVSDPAPTVVVAGREGGEVRRWVDRVAVLSAGRLAQVGPPDEVYRRPVSLEVGEVMGELNRIPATFDGRVLQAGASRIVPEAVPSGLTAGSRVVMAVRPVDLSPAQPGTPFRLRLHGTVGRVERAGPHQRVLFGLGRQRGTGFCGVVDPDYRIRVGDRLDWGLDPGRLRLYDPVTGRAW